MASAGPRDPRRRETIRRLRGKRKSCANTLRSTRGDGKEDAMLVSIGTAPQHTVDAVDLLLECHARIRSFTTLAKTIGETPELGGEEVSDACKRVARYFGEAFPLHMRDEDESLLPRLRGVDRKLDAALDEMADEHGTHGLALASLLSVLKEVQDDPADATHRVRLLTAALLLEKLFAKHLAREEQVIFPAVRTLLDVKAREAMLQEIRSRRMHFS